MSVLSSQADDGGVGGVEEERPDGDLPAPDKRGVRAELLRRDSEGEERVFGCDGVAREAQGVRERAAGARGLRADVSQRVPVQRDGRRGVEVDSDVLREGRVVLE